MSEGSLQHMGFQPIIGSVTLKMIKSSGPIISRVLFPRICGVHLLDDLP